MLQWNGERRQGFNDTQVAIITASDGGCHMPRIRQPSCNVSVRDTLCPSITCRTDSSRGLDVVFDLDCFKWNN